MRDLHEQSLHRLSTWERPCHNFYKHGKEHTPRFQLPNVAPDEMLGQHSVELFGDLQFEDDAPVVMAIPGKPAQLNKFVLFKSADCAWLW